MALGFSRDIIMSTDKSYFFLESPEKESDGNSFFHELFHEYFFEGLKYELGLDPDPRYFLLPVTLLTFNTETEN